MGAGPGAAAQTLINLALVGLTVVVCVRARAARRNPRTRIGWYGAVAGTVALLTQGTVIPLGLLDRTFGGTNIFKLVQGVLTMVAIWLVVQAVIAPASARARSLDWRLPLGLTLVFSAVFLTIPGRGPTDFWFVERGAATSTQIWLYGVVHMAGIGAVAGQLLRAAKSALEPSAGFFRGGAASIMAACFSEIVDLTLTRHGRPSKLVAEAFDPLFYLGIVAVIVGIARSALAAKRMRAKREQLIERLNRLTVASPAQVDTGPAGIAPGLTEHEEELLMRRIALEDEAIASGRELSADEREVLRQVDAYLSRPSRNSTA